TYSGLAAVSLLRNHPAMPGKSAIIPALLIWLCALPPVDAGLARYCELVVADPPGVRSSLGMRVTYLGDERLSLRNGEARAAG
ncbi:MAG: hypothetical protein M3480_06305, partial [Verrucomicrobiota bacterium]|nr:hypothetical protein [Verrucomicrobiota bacterium]